MENTKNTHNKRDVYYMRRTYENPGDIFVNEKKKSACSNNKYLREKTQCEA